MDLRFLDGLLRKSLFNDPIAPFLFLEGNEGNGFSFCGKAIKGIQWVSWAGILAVR
jgi:hypothetical protein